MATTTIGGVTVESQIMRLDAVGFKAQMKRLKKGMNTAALRKSAREGAKLVAKKAAQNAPRGSNRGKAQVFKDGTKKTKLAKSIRVKERKGRKRGQTGEVSMDVGWLSTAFHGNFIHGGAKAATYGPVKMKAFKMPKGNDPPFIRGMVTIPRRPKDPFLRSAYRSERPRAFRAMRQTMNQIQAKAVARG